MAMLASQQKTGSKYRLEVGVATAQLHLHLVAVGIIMFELCCQCYSCNGSYAERKPLPPMLPHKDYLDCEFELRVFVKPRHSHHFTQTHTIGLSFLVICRHLAIPNVKFNADKN